jgi:hypothetical protein
VRDLDTVLRQKEDDLERVRREILALLLVIPLLADDPPREVRHDLLSNAFRKVAAPSDNGMADLELYYPFVKRMRLTEQP